MNLVITLEHRFDRTPEGAVWTQTMFAHSYWMRYLAVFDHVRVMARVRDVSSVPPDWIRADGEGVSFAAVPYYLGPWQYLLRARNVQRTARNAIGLNDAIIMYAPSQLAACIEPMLRRTGHPYGLYVIGDPYDVFAPGSVRHPLRPFFRWLFTRRLRRHCTEACAVAYITERALQRRYSRILGGFSIHFTMTELPDTAIVPVARIYRQDVSTVTLITVGTLAQLYKAPDVLIDAVAVCIREGLDLKLSIVGDGKHRKELEARVASLGMGERIKFQGQVSAGDAVRAQLDQADLFILPSWQEGLPRAMIEAMARGLPCIGSTVGGIPELLPPEDMVPPGNVVALACKIREVVTNVERMTLMSARNLEKAKEHRDEAVRNRRNAFYQHVREKTEVWMKLKGNESSLVSQI